MINVIPSAHNAAWFIQEKTLIPYSALFYRIVHVMLVCMKITEFTGCICLLAKLHNAICAPSA